MKNKEIKNIIILTLTILFVVYVFYEDKRLQEDMNRLDKSIKYNNSDLIVTSLNQESKEFKYIKQQLEFMHARIDDMYTWSLIFAGLLFSLGVYSSITTRNIAKNIATSEMDELKDKIQNQVDGTIDSMRLMLSHQSKIYKKDNDD